MNKSTKTLTTTCPFCRTQIRFNRTPRLRDIIVCHECNESLEVVSLSPLQVDWYVRDDEISWADADVDEYDDRFARYDRYD